MRIGIDVNNLSQSENLTGIGNYLYNILKNLERIDQKNEYFLYNYEDINFQPRNQKWHKRVYSCFLSKSHTVRSNTVLMRCLSDDKVDIFWQPGGGLLPFFIPRKIKTLVTIHDLVFYYYPRTMEWRNLLFNRLLFKRSCKRADAIIAVSNSTARIIMELIPNVLNAQKIAVIYLGGGNEKFKPLDTKQSKNFVKEKFNIDNDYILFVGTVEPRKNISALIEAFVSLVRRRDKFNYQIVIVGKEGWGSKQVFNLMRQLNIDEKYVKLLGYIDDDDLVYLYSGALLFIMPSIYEGFGLPILEAMACGCPVITSNVSSMPEVAGEAALLIDPNKIDDIAHAIYNVTIDVALRQRMRMKGFENIKRFSWKGAAKQTLEIFNSFVGQ